MAYDDYEDDFEQDGPKALRDALDKANKQNKDLLARLEKLESEKKESTLAEILKAKGVSPKAARFLKSDGIDADEDAVTKWLADNADLFPANTESKGDDEKPTAEKQEATETKPEPQQDPEAAAALAAMQQVQDLEASGTSGTGAGDLASVLGQLNQNQDISYDDAIKALTQLGAPGLSGE